MIRKDKLAFGQIRLATIDETVVDAALKSLPAADVKNTAAYVLLHVHYFESGGEDEKFLGVHRSPEEALKRVREEYSKLPGFDQADGEFIIDSYTVGADHWDCGFACRCPSSFVADANRFMGEPSDDEGVNIVFCKPSVYVLQHFHYLPDFEDEERLLGIYSSAAQCRDRIDQHFSRLPGFKCSNGEFVLERFELGRNSWTDGFVTV